MNPLLKPAELLYRGVNRVRRSLYRRGVLRAQSLPRPVISIGNTAIGGSGKTPAVIAIARLLSDRGYKVAVLTRGYGRSSDGQGLLDSLDTVKWGDEPVLIKKSVKKVDVIVGHNRYANALKYLSNKKCDVFVLDDGFQHLQLARDLDIVIDPAPGYRREGPSALADADVVMPRRIRPAGLDLLRGKRAFAFAGLADNEQFFAMLRREGVELAGSSAYPDHHGYTAADLESIHAAARAVAAETIVTTEKDAVKIADPSIAAIGIDFELSAEVVNRVLETVSR